MNAVACAHCGGSFAARRADARYCSARCRVAAARNRSVTDAACVAGIRNTPPKTRVTAAPGVTDARSVTDGRGVYEYPAAGLGGRTPEDITAFVERLLAMGSTFILARDGRTVWHEPAPDVMRSLLAATTRPTRREVETGLLWLALGEAPRPLVYRCIKRATERARALGVTVDELLREDG